MRLRMLFGGVCLALASLAGAASSAPSATPTASPLPEAMFVITGRGWGHGVGMSQYGALGFARRGVPYTRILAHYYRGTDVSRVPTTRVRVLLAEGRRRLALLSEAPFKVRDGAGKVHRLDAGEHELGPALKVKRLGAKKAAALPGPLMFSPGNVALRLRLPNKAARRYRGWIQVDVKGKGLRAINVVRLEDYLLGVVPDEVPDTWPPEALKAQAVAARSYALVTRKSGDFDLHSDTRSQVYGGVDAETFPTTAAVEATAGQVVTYKGKLAVTYFFSTSGGRTAAIHHAWPGSKPVPYLVSVADPYDGLSPHHKWGPISFSSKAVVKRLRIAKSALDLIAVRNASSRVTSVLAVGPEAQINIAGGDVRRALDLRSTWFTIGVLSLAPPGVPATYGTGATLTGKARNLSGVMLEQKVSGGIWEPAAAVSAAKDGSFSVTVRPSESTQYRLATGRVKTSPVRVLVAPAIRFALAEGGSALKGTVRPAFRGISVEIQRLEGSSWRVVERAPLDATGAFRTRLPPRPGTYRARVAPGRGFAPGFTPVLRVVAA